MTRKRKPCKTYIKEFKLEALLLMEQSDRPDYASDYRLRGQALHFT